MPGCDGASHQQQLIINSKQISRKCTPGQMAEAGVKEILRHFLVHSDVVIGTKHGPVGERAADHFIPGRRVVHTLDEVVEERLDVAYVVERLDGGDDFAPLERACQRLNIRLLRLGLRAVETMSLPSSSVGHRGGSSDSAALR